MEDDEHGETSMITIEIDTGDMKPRRQRLHAFYREDGGIKITAMQRKGMELRNTLQVVPRKWLDKVLSESVEWDQPEEDLPDRTLYSDGEDGSTSTADQEEIQSVTDCLEAEIPAITEKEDHHI